MGISALRNRQLGSALPIGILAACCLALVMLLLAGSPAYACSTSGAPAVTTDKADYGALETAIISGSGFGCGEALSVRVTTPDGSMLSGDGSGSAGPDAVVTDDNGEFVLNYALSGVFADGATYVGQEGEYFVEVLAADGSVLATVTFTDTHFRFGHITWRRIAGTQVQFTITHAWRSTDCDSGAVNFGDGFSSNFGGPTIALLSDAGGNQYCVRQDQVMHTYPSEGPYVAEWAGCCRISNLINAPDGSWRVRTVVDLRNGNNGSPLSSIPPILQLPRTIPGQMATYQLGVSDTDGDAVTCRMATSGESSIGTAAGAGGNLLQVSQSCELQWDTSAAPTNPTYPKYGVQVMLQENRPDGTVNDVALDFIVEIVGGGGNQPPTCTLTGAASNVISVGQPFSIGATGVDPEGLAMTLQALNLPSGSSLNPVVGSPVASGDTATFSWTPTAADAGQGFAATLIFIDSLGLQDSCSFSVQVPANQPPVVAADNASVAVDEGQTASNTGTYGDPNGDTVTLSASAGAVTDLGGGAWSWSFLTGNGPAESQTVTITASDGTGSTDTTFELTVNNLPPAIQSLNANPVVEVNEAVNVSVVYDDPGTADTHTVVWSWGDGSPDGSGDAAGHSYGAANIYEVCATVTDSDGASDSACTDVVVYNPNGGWETGGGSASGDGFAFYARYNGGNLTGKMKYVCVDKKTGSSRTFWADVYDWMVIVAPNAILQGSGHFEDDPGTTYGFTLETLDERYSAAHTADELGIAIWTIDDPNTFVCKVKQQPVDPGAKIGLHGVPAEGVAEPEVRIAGNPPADVIRRLTGEDPGTHDPQNRLYMPLLR